jgi:hypothetical protein
MSFYLDEASRFERLGHWEVRTKLEILRSAPVAGQLQEMRQSPASFFELEKLLRVCETPELDIAVHRQLSARQFEANYVARALEPLQLASLEDVHGPSFAARFVHEGDLLAQLDDASLRLQLLEAESTISSFREDVTARRNDIATWSRHRTAANERTFSYLEALQRRLTPVSERILALSESELAILQAEEKRRRATAPAGNPRAETEPPSELA